MQRNTHTFMPTTLGTPRRTRATVRRIRQSAALLVLLGAALTACSDDSTTGPMPSSEIAVDAASVDFGALDVRFGAGPQTELTIQNTGAVDLVVSSAAVAGANASAFVYDGPSSFTISAGGTQTVRVAFNPAGAGGQSATLQLASNDPDTPTLSVALAGQGVAATYRQVDRMGIPALNTVFNHPPVFSKQAYNTATPAGDLAAYRAQFETVLGAVANADPAATAALLLPDELPVNLGASVTRFAELTGRALSDDAVDVALLVTVGVPSLQSDNVSANDRAFLTAFPYLATPH